MSYSEGYDWRCMNCGGFHECGNCPYYEDQRWENRPDISWEGDEYFNPWNPPYYQHYGAHEHQPLEHEEPHQGHEGGKKSLEELLEGFITRMDNNYNNREAAIKNLEIRIQELSRQFMEESQCSFQSVALIAPVEESEELQIDEKRDHELIEENPSVQTLEEEEEEPPKEFSTDDLELESYNSKGDQEGKLVECEESIIPQGLEGDEEEELPEEASEDILEL